MAMASSTTDLFLSLVIMGVTAVLLVWYRRHKSSAAIIVRKLPSGPPALPIIGHLHLMGPNPHQIFYHLSQSYGPLFSLRFGSVPVIVASTPATAKQILQTHDHIFCGRLPTIADRYINGYRSIRAAQPGPYWRLIRQICAMEFFTTQRLDSFRTMRSQEVGDLLRAVLSDARHHDRGVVEVRSHLHTTATNIIARMMLGKRLPELSASQADPSLHIRTLIPHMMHLAGSFNVSDFIRPLAVFDLQRIAKRSKELGSKINTVFQEVIDRRRQERVSPASLASSTRPHDFLDTLLSASASDKHKDIQITDENINAVLLNMFSGGTDTSSLTIEWALAELLKNPQKLHFLQEELENVVGMSRRVQEADIPRLPYLQAVVKETMRLHPAGPLLIPHFSSQPCQIYDYEIPTGTLAFVNIWAIGRDPRTWENPLEFSPERFLTNNVDARGQHFELLPFGSGRRICPGVVLGLLSVKTIIANLVHCFSWKSIDNHDFSERFNLVLALEHPLRAKASLKVLECIISD